MRGIPGRQAFTQGVPPFQHQNRHRCRRLRLDARDRLPPLQPPDRRRSRTARPDYRGRRQRQLSSAYAVLCELGIEKQVPIVGLAKRIEEIFFPGDPMPYYLSRTGEPLKVVCHIRDEAHRFGITFHRQKRSKAFIHSELENIEGVGPKTIELLLRHFRTVEKIRTAPAEELSALVGPAKAARLIVHFGRQ